jgi:hypothetical protein
MFARCMPSVACLRVALPCRSGAPAVDTAAACVAARALAEAVALECAHERLAQRLAAKEMLEREAFALYLQALAAAHVANVPAAPLCSAN